VGRGVGDGSAVAVSVGAVLASKGCSTLTVAVGSTTTRAKDGGSVGTGVGAVSAKTTGLARVAVGRGASVTIGSAIAIGETAAGAWQPASSRSVMVDRSSGRSQLPAIRNLKSEIANTLPALLQQRSPRW
jgi:hypothetical protein